MVRVALYARVSKKEDQTPENQLVRLREHAAAQGWTVQGEYVDHISGVKDNRPALDKMRAACRARWVDVVLFTKLDRLGRSTLHLHEVSNEARTFKVRLVALDQNLDTDSPMGQFFFTIVAAIAQLEREFIRERTKDGLALKRAQGVRIGKHPRRCDCGIAGRVKGLDGRVHTVKHDGQSDLMPTRASGRRPRGEAGEPVSPVTGGVGLHV